MTQVFTRTTETSKGPARRCTMWSMPAVLLFIDAPIILSRVEALLIPSIGGTRDPLWAVLRQEKTSMSVCYLEGTF